jgi:hypothetical protein
VGFARREVPDCDPPSMKPLLLLSTLSLGAVLTATAHAKDIVVKKTWEVARPAAELVEVLAAYDQYCARGCRYHVPSVEVAHILSYSKHDDDFYIWTSVKDIEDSTWFSHFTVKRREHGARVEVRMVSPGLAVTLAKASKREHDPSVDGAANVYELEEVYAGDRFVKTRVTLTEIVSISGVSAIFGSGIVRDRLEENVRAMQANLGRPQAPAARRDSK